MIFEPTDLHGVVRIIPDPNRDDRGSFTRLFDDEIFRRNGLNATFPQHSAATNLRRGVLRGLHFQDAPHEEVKLIRCTRGVVFDVLVDVRKSSPTYGRWQSFELADEEQMQLYVPGGVAHGYQVLTDGADMHYLISAPYVASCARGFRFDSPSLSIAWPIADAFLSDRDRAHPAFEL